MRRCAAWVTEWSGKIRRNLPVKIFCFTCLLLLAVCIVTYGLIAWMMPVTYQADRNRVLSEQAESLIQELSKTTLSACGPLLEKFASDYDAQVSILDETGQPVAGTKDLAQTEEEEGRVTFSQIQTEEGMTLQTNESIHITQTVATPFSFQGSQDVYQLMVVGRIRGVNQAMEALGKLWPWLLASVVSVSILGSFFYARYVTRLSRAMGELQGANEALRRDMEREREMERQRMEFFAAASHELKTPITIVKGQLGGMLDGVGVYADRERYLARSLQVMGSMERLVGELLTLSRMEGEKVRRGIKPLSGGIHGPLCPKGADAACFPCAGPSGTGRVEFTLQGGLQSFNQWSHVFPGRGGTFSLCSGGRGADLFLSGKHRGSPVRRKDSPSV